MKNLFKMLLANRKLCFFMISLVLYSLFSFLFFSDATSFGQFFLKNIPMNSVLDFRESGYSVTDVRKAFSEFSIFGRRDYVRNLYTIDIVHPLFLAFVLASFLLTSIRLLSGKKFWTYLVCVLPLFYFVSDINRKHSDFYYDFSATPNIHWACQVFFKCFSF